MTYDYDTILYNAVSTLSVQVEKERNLSQQEINIRFLSYLYNKEEGANGFHHDKSDTGFTLLF